MIALGLVIVVVLSVLGACVAADCDSEEGAVLLFLLAWIALSFLGVMV